MLVQKERALRNLKIIVFCLMPLYAQTQDTKHIPKQSDKTEQTVEKQQPKPLHEKIIRTIKIVRNNPNKYLTEAAIKTYVPYKEGGPFDPQKSNLAIKKLFNLGFFDQIQLRGSNVIDDKVDIFFILNELPEVIDIEITGNKNLSDQKIEKELKLSDLRAISERKLNEIVRKIKKLYQEKDFHTVDIKSEIKISDGNKATVIINIDENAKSLIKRIFFNGNTHVPSKNLKRAIFSREDWLFGFITKAGSYQADKFEQDKRYLENYYKTLGYISAKVANAKVSLDPKTKQYTVTFTINEGDQYRIKDLHVQGNDKLSEYELLQHLPMKSGAIYSMKDIMDSIETLKKIYGEFGYIFVDIQPSIVPDEENKTVNISFEVDLGDKVYLNRITIKGNKKTRDHIVRRQILLHEGELLSHQRMELSKQRVEALSYWDKEEGVQWKINRLNDNLADLDMILHEAKTGKLIGGLGWGGNEMNASSAASGFNWTLDVSDVNFLGKGLQFNANARWSREEWSTAIDFTEPYLMDRPISVGYNFHLNKISRSEDLNQIKDLSERYMGTSFHAGYMYSGWEPTTFLRGVVGIENIKLNNRPTLADNVGHLPGANAYQRIILEQFKNGTMTYLNLEAGQDIRNHVVHPSGGFQWSTLARAGLPTQKFGFFKIDFDYSWYTSLIDEYGLVLCFHTHLGYVKPLKNKTIPFRELFNIGGIASVRGFEWGEISPSFMLDPYIKEDDITGRMGEPIGGEKAFFVNLELSFPIKKDYTLKGTIFYDGGSGWQPPRLPITSEDCCKFIRNASFDYRQSIGIGILMLQPQNLKIDWAFKLDRRPGEKAYEVHFSTYKQF